MSNYQISCWQARTQILLFLIKYTFYNYMKIIGFFLNNSSFLKFPLFSSGVKFPCPFIQWKINQLLDSYLIRSEENIGLVNGDYEKRTKYFRVFSCRAAFVSEHNKLFPLGGGSNGWDSGATIKRRGKSAQVPPCSLRLYIVSERNHFTMCIRRKKE